MERFNLVSIEWRIYKAWCKETSYTPEQWDKNDESFGQCAVTAVLVQDLLGGDLMRGYAINKEHGIRTRHYWNRFGENWVDLTWQQFPPGTQITVPEDASRKQLLANKWMKERYELLVDRFWSVNGPT